MSKGSLFWGNASGKLGESVFYRAGGEQRNRTYVKNIKNPKTKAQMSNRIQMLNLTTIFKELADILRFSFPNRSSKESGFNAFVKANKSTTSSVNLQSNLEQASVAPYQYFVSKGEPITISTVSSSEDYNGNVISFGESNDADLLAVIFSYTDANGKLMVNTAQFRAMTADGVSTAAEDFQGPDGFVYQQVLEAYGYNEGSILATK